MFTGGVVGKALKGPICTYEFSGGVNMDHSKQVSARAEYALCFSASLCFSGS